MSAHLIPEPDPALVTCAQQRDAAGKPTPEARKAFESLCVQVENLIYNFFGLKAANEQDAQDLTQTTFYKAWRELPAKDPAAPFVAWMKTIAINLCKDYWKKKQKE